MKSNKAPRFSVATNWDNDLLEQLSHVGQIDSFFGKLPADEVGGVRPTLILPPVSKEAAEEHIDLCHQFGWEFNYLLNATCLGNIESTRQGYSEIVALLGWLEDCGVDIITVSTSYLLELIKHRFPSFKVQVGSLAGIGTVQEARRYEDLGADILVLEECANRDFEALRKIRQAVDCEIELIANTSCLLDCPYRLFHANMGSHASRSTDPTQGFYIDFCLSQCLSHKLEPLELMRSPWIRPEDLGFYVNLGIDRFKLPDRSQKTSTLVKIVSSYIDQKCDNLMELLGPDGSFFNPENPPPFLNSCFLDRPEYVDVEQLFTLFAKAMATKVDRQIISENLGPSFVKFFDKNVSCRDRLCNDCGYCEKMAAKAIRIDINQANKARKELKNLSDAIITGKLYKERGGTGDSRVARHV